MSQMVSDLSVLKVVVVPSRSPSSVSSDANSPPVVAWQDFVKVELQSGVPGFADCLDAEVDDSKIVVTSNVCNRERPRLCSVEALSESMLRQNVVDLVVIRSTCCVLFPKP